MVTSTNPLTEDQVNARLKGTIVENTCAEVYRFAGTIQSAASENVLTTQWSHIDKAGPGDIQMTIPAIAFMEALPDGGILDKLPVQLRRVDYTLRKLCRIFCAGPQRRKKESACIKKNLRELNMYLECPNALASTFTRILIHADGNV